MIVLQCLLGFLVRFLVSLLRLDERLHLVGEVEREFGAFIEVFLQERRQIIQRPEANGEISNLSFFPEVFDQSVQFFDDDGLQVFRDDFVLTGEVVDFIQEGLESFAGAVPACKNPSE